MIVTLISDPTYGWIARDIIGQCLGEVSAMAESLGPEQVIVIAPVVPGSYYPDLDAAWVEEHLHRSIDAAPWQTAIVPSTTTTYAARVIQGVYAALATILSGPSTGLWRIEGRPGLSHWVGTVRYAVAALQWPELPVASTEYTGVPVIIHRTIPVVDPLAETVGATAEGPSASPILVDFTP